MIYYAGIGSRRSPDDICDLMTEIAREFARRGVVLRSGGAERADKAFERGAGALAEIYHSGEYMQEPVIAWSRDPNHATHFYGSPLGHYEIAERFHQAWGSCSSWARALHARNVSQNLGLYPGETPVSSSVVCWTPDGSLDGSSRTAGGTGQALRIAAAYGVHVVNLQRPDHREMAERWLAGEKVT